MDSSPYPLPAGEGQTNTPINRLNQGEVLTPRIEKSVFISYHRNLFSPKSDAPIFESASQIFIVVFGGDVQRTEGVAPPFTHSPVLISMQSLPQAGFVMICLLQPFYSILLRYFLVGCIFKSTCFLRYSQLIQLIKEILQAARDCHPQIS